MKKFNQFALLGAAALTGAVFTACSSDDDLANVNPTFDGEAVKTSFTISVGDVKSPTRMQADPVQQDELFNGMTDIYLFPAKAAITGTTVTSESYIKLPDFTAFDPKVLDAKGKIYSDVAFSVGVRNFLFYAASQTPGNGKLRASYLKMPMAEFHGTADWDPEPLLTSSVVENIHFDLVPIQKEKTLTEVKAMDAAIATIKPLNDVDAAITARISAAGAGTTAATELTALQKTLRNDISAAGASTPDYKPYAGSSLSQKALMTKVYTAVKNLETLITATYTQPIIDAIEALFTVSGNATEGFTLTWKNDPKFPSDDTVLGLPDGSAAVQFVTDKFEYVKPSVDGLSVPDFNKYVYPARLYYTINTPAMVKDAEYLSTLNNEYPTWAEVKTNGAYDEGAVTAATRSVIMKDQVQYAVGRLDVQVRVKPSATITDSGSRDLLDASNNPIPQPVTVPGNGYKLTGVLIGGQKNVAWDFTPTGSDEFTIWDNVMGNDIYAKQQAAYAGDNYTLALETAADVKVKVALEFENTGNDFYGIDHNIIPAGTKFYLVAELDPTTNTTYKEQDPETPWGTTTPEKFINQVFKQDYVTTAKLTINETALSKAYNVVPDLRSPKLEFGLSVDLHWRKGITFEQDFQ